MNYLISSITITDETIFITTYKWFSYDPINESYQIPDIEVQKTVGYDFFRGKKIHEITITGSKKDKYYIVDEFFDDIDELLNKLNLSPQVRT